MKKTALLLFTLLSTAAFASTCQANLEDEYLQRSRGTRFDYMPSFKKAFTLKGGEVYQANFRKSFGPYKTDKVLLKVTGSIHSGWFSELIISDLDCNLEMIREIASE